MEIGASRHGFPTLSWAPGDVLLTVLNAKNGKGRPTVSHKNTHWRNQQVLPLKFLGLFWHVQLGTWRTRALYGGNRMREDWGLGGASVLAATRTSQERGSRHHPS